MICTNCGQPVDGNFCAHCGQSVTVDEQKLIVKMTWRYQSCNQRKNVKHFAGNVCPIESNTNNVNQAYAFAFSCLHLSTLSRRLNTRTLI
jgi:hypothetical protein